MTSSMYGANFPQDFQAALTQYNRSQFAEAKEAFTKLSESGPTPAAKDQALTYAAYCEVALKQPDAATALASRIKDKYLGILCRMNLFSMQAKFADIVELSQGEDFEKWPDPMIYEALLCRANAFARTRVHANAERDYRGAIEHTASDSEKAQVYLRLGGLYGDKDKGDPRALEAYGEVLKVNGGVTAVCRAVSARAKLFVAQGKGELALAEFDRLKDITQQPHWSTVQMSYAEVCTSLGMTEEALARYRAVVASVNPPADLRELAQKRINTQLK